MSDTRLPDGRCKARDAYGFRCAFAVGHGGSHLAEGEYFTADGRSTRKEPVAKSEQARLDEALIRWSVVCRTWQDMAGGHQPDLGAFLAGWFLRHLTESMPRVAFLCDSFAAGWAEAESSIAVSEQQEPSTGGDQAEACTGLTARWCPRCGECTCQLPPIDDPRCPLHGVASSHAEPREPELTPYEEIRRLHDPSSAVASMSDEDVAVYARSLDLGSGYSDQVIRQALRKISREGAA